MTRRLPRPLAINLAVLSSLICGATVAHAQVIQCTCGFQADSGYAAYGTQAACSTMVKDGRSCDVAFGGMGADDPQVAREMQSKPTNTGELATAVDNYQSHALQITIENLDALRAGDLAKITTPKFIAEALPVYMRATYLRRNSNLSVETANHLDLIVDTIADKLSDEISAVFTRSIPPQTVHLADDAYVEIVPGAVRLNFQKNIYISVVFFSSLNNS